jgi:Transglutaminase-like superfamily
MVQRMEREAYRRPGALTDLTPAQQKAVAEIGDDPRTLCLAAQQVLVLPGIPIGSDPAPGREQERNLRPASAILRTALALDDRSLSRPRPLDRRVIGTCRHFAVLSCAFLRSRGIAARARCGFATYFRPGLAVDHWITEYWHEEHARWVRIDSEIVAIDLGLGVDASELAAGAFLTGPEAWQRYRDGADATAFGVHDTDNWGVAEIVGNAIRDLAALQRVEMLPWDEWGPMRAWYDGTITPDVETLMDDLVAATIGEDEADAAELYERAPVPAALIR